MKKIGKERDEETRNVLENVLENVPDKLLEELTERQRIILDLINRNPTISGEEMSQKIGVTLKTIQRDLKAMRNIVRRVGPDNGGYWEIIK